MRFKEIKNRNPVFLRGFHTDIAAVLCEEPVARAAISELVVLKTFVLQEAVRVTGSEVQTTVTTDFFMYVQTSIFWLDSCIVCAVRQERRKEGMPPGMFGSLKEIFYIDKLMAIRGVGLITVSGFIAEVGDIRTFYFVYPKPTIFVPDIEKCPSPWFIYLR